MQPCCLWVLRKSGATCLNPWEKLSQAKRREGGELEVTVQTTGWQFLHLLSPYNSLHDCQRSGCFQQRDKKYKTSLGLFLTSFHSQLGRYFASLGKPYTSEILLSILTMNNVIEKKTIIMMKLNYIFIKIKFCKHDMLWHKYEYRQLDSQKHLT